MGIGALHSKGANGRKISGLFFIAACKLLCTCYLIGYRPNSFYALYKACTLAGGVPAWMF